jgi:hypothetical protein
MIAGSMIAAYQSRGLTANQTLRELRTAGHGIRRETFLRLWGEVAAGRANRSEEASRPLNAVPTGNELRTLTTRQATGVMQMVEVYLKDKQTGLVIPKNFSVTSPRGVPRGDVVNAAVELYSQDDSRYPTTLLAAVHVGSYRLTPERGVA